MPYDGDDKANIITDIRHGKRPSRPTDPGCNRWLQDPVWGAITICWSDKPQQRYKLSVVYRVFAKYGQGEARNVQLGNLNIRNYRNLLIAP